MDDIFHRTELAERYAAELLDPSPASVFASGLFLAAPRRTGKSTFLREDLRPALERAGAHVLYADLWEDPAKDPGTVIVDAIRAALANREGVLARLSRVTGMDLESVSAAGATVSLERVGLGTDVSLSQALQALSDDVRRPIVLLLDEAQHAITSRAGSDALYALKAARDALNASERHGLRIVATGSSRDKLAVLRNGKGQAFFGAPLVEFPPLDEHYVRWFLGHLARGGEVELGRAVDLFARAGHRPEILNAAAAALDFELGADEDPGARLAGLVALEIERVDAEALGELHALTPLQSTVLREMAERGKAFAPFEAATMSRYARTLAAIDPDGERVPNTPNVQAALQALQERGLVWRASRGVYAIEDERYVELMRREGMIGPAA